MALWTTWSERGSSRERLRRCAAEVPLCEVLRDSVWREIREAPFLEVLVEPDLRLPLTLDEIVEEDSVLIVRRRACAPATQPLPAPRPATPLAEDSESKTKESKEREADLEEVRALMREWFPHEDCRKSVPREESKYCAPEAASPVAARTRNRQKAKSAATVQGR